MGLNDDDNFKAIINCAGAEIFSLSELTKKFGPHLAKILLCHNKSFWGDINEKAIDFIINNNSCRFYRKIGSNYKAKKYLADVSLLREKSGLPRMTWVDLKVFPSSHAYDFMKFCEKSEKVMETLVQNKHWKELSKDREILSEVKQKEIKTLKEGNVNDASILKIKEVSKKISDIDNYRKKTLGYFNSVNEKRYKSFLSSISEYKPNSDLYLKALKKDQYVCVNKSMTDMQKEIDGVEKNIQKWKSDLKAAIESKIVIETKNRTEMFMDKIEGMKSNNESKSEIENKWEKVRDGFSGLKKTKEVENIISKNPFEIDFTLIEDSEVVINTDTLLSNCDKVKTRSLKKKKCKLLLTSEKAIDAVVKKRTQFVQKVVNIESFIKVLDKLKKEGKSLSIKSFYKKIKRCKYKRSRLKYALKKTAGLKLGAKRSRESNFDDESRKKSRKMNFCCVTFKKSIEVIVKRLRITNLIKKANLWKESYEKRVKDRKAKEQFELTKILCKIRSDEINREREERSARKMKVVKDEPKEVVVEKKEEKRERINIYGIKFSSEIEITEDLIELPHSFDQSWLDRRKHITNARELFAEFRLKCKDNDKESNMIRDLSEDELIMLDEDTQYELIMLAMASV